MTLTQIDTLTLDTVFFNILDRLLDYSVVPTGEQFFILLQDDTLSLYERLTVHSLLTKPTLAEMDAEFLIYQEELRVIEQARLDEINRIALLQDRIEVLEDTHTLAQTINRFQPNMALEFKRIVDENDIVALEEFEAANTIHIAAKAKKDARQIKKDKGDKDKAISEECLSLISGGNEGLTEAEVDQMILTFADIYEAFKQRRPAKALRLIKLVPNDGVIDALKQELIDELTEHGIL